MILIIQTSLLLALLKELPLTNNESVIVNSENIAYSPQEAWIFSSSFRQNIIFGKPYQEEKFNRIIKSVSLDKVILILSFIFNPIYYD